jgi:hypothetical protein
MYTSCILLNAPLCAFLKYTLLIKKKMYVADCMSVCVCVCVCERERERERERDGEKVWFEHHLIITLGWRVSTYNDSRTKGKIASTKSWSIPLALYMRASFNFTFSFSHHGLDFSGSGRSIESINMTHKPT